MKGFVLALAGCLTLAIPAAAQQSAILGTWRADLKDAARSDAPRLVVVRADSSASYGTETVRWRLVKGDSIALALGGEWINYKMRLRGQTLTLSGGDLDKPITLRKVGPASARPDSIPVPPDPDRM